MNKKILMLAVIACLIGAIAAVTYGSLGGAPTPWVHDVSIEPVATGLWSPWTPVTRMLPTMQPAAKNVVKTDVIVNKMLSGPTALLVNTWNSVNPHDSYSGTPVTVIGDGGEMWTGKFSSYGFGTSDYTNVQYGDNAQTVMPGSLTGVKIKCGRDSANSQYFICVIGNNAGNLAVYELGINLAPSGLTYTLNNFPMVAEITQNGDTVFTVTHDFNVNEDGRAGTLYLQIKSNGQLQFANTFVNWYQESSPSPGATVTNIKTVDFVQVDDNLQAAVLDVQLGGKTFRTAMLDYIEHSGGIHGSIAWEFDDAFAPNTGVFQPNFIVKKPAPSSTDPDMLVFAISGHDQLTLSDATKFLVLGQISEFNYAPSGLPVDITGSDIVTTGWQVQDTAGSYWGPEAYDNSGSVVPDYSPIPIQGNSWVGFTATNWETTPATPYSSGLLLQYNPYTTSLMARELLGFTSGTLSLDTDVAGKEMLFSATLLTPAKHSVVARDSTNQLLFMAILNDNLDVTPSNIYGTGWYANNVDKLLDVESHAAYFTRSTNEYICVFQTVFTQEPDCLQSFATNGVNTYTADKSLVWLLGLLSRNTMLQGYPITAYLENLFATSHSNSSLQSTAFLYNGTGKATNPNGTIQFGALKQVYIQTLTPNINILDFYLTFQKFTGYFDTTTNTCLNCTFHNGLGNTSNTAGICQAEFEKVGGMYPKYNLTINLTLPQPINFPYLAIGCTTAYEAIIKSLGACQNNLPVNHTENIHSHMAWTIPSPPVGWSITNGIKINITNINGSISLPLGVMTPQPGGEMIACEIQGIYDVNYPNISQNWTIYKTITATGMH